ncbi:hypothetical protein [Herbaspirillum sp.]|uniref:hypothetical protein n=1 Tax=Herbaspirillum sp. TaxID=1890675 RepID=UPI000C0B44BD|nr:hypothetical protein [Herbaspirillum sp.]MAF02091.1 hypothetical protein [Herbaspirillum sp.]|tara:strand:+ start:13742 stop:14338 length:597 start_codon:yes stop_codon:yes gene_type:complete
MFDEFETDIIDVLKPDGTLVAENLRASVQNGNFVGFNANGVLVEPDYLVVRKMSNGGKEKYVVVEPNFYKGDDTFPAHYQMTVRRAALAAKAPAPGHTLNINMTGHGSRVNFQSTDNSVNTVYVNSQVSQHLDNLRTEIRESDLSTKDKDEAFEIVDQVEQNAQSAKPKKTIVAALLGALPDVAKFATSVSSILACFS